MTLEEAKNLQWNDILHCEPCKRTIGPRGGITTHVEAWRINGVVKRWKRQPDRIRVPIKHGMRDYAYLENVDLPYFHKAEDCEKHILVTDNRKGK